MIEAIFDFFDIFTGYLTDPGGTYKGAFIRTVKVSLGIIVLSLLIYYFVYLPFNQHKFRESFENERQCPNILVQVGKDILLYNSRLAKIPGVNPIRFKNLEDYVEYIKWQRSQKIECPILFLQHSYDTQGKSVFKNRPDPTDLQGGLPPLPGLFPQDLTRTKLVDAGHNDPPYNQNLYPGFDPQNQYIGVETPLDKMYHQNIGGVSPSAMDKNWGGVKYTHKLVKEGDYKEDNVKIFVPS